MIPGVQSLGADTASIDGNTPDYQAAHTAGVRFAGVRASQHVYPDSYYHRDIDKVRASGIVPLAYHMPGWGPKAATPKAQIAACRAAIGGNIVRGKDLPLAIDVESGLSNGSFRSFGVPVSAIVESIRQLTLEVQDQFDCNPFIYTSYNQAYDLGLPVMPWAAKLPLWIKTAYEVASHHSPITFAPHTPHAAYDKDDAKNYYRIPPPWRGWQIQQFQGDAVGLTGFNKTVDLNRFNVARPGDSGAHIAQYALHLFPERDDSGVYGPELEASVRALQTAQQFVVDAVIGPATAAAILWLP